MSDMRRSITALCLALVALCAMGSAMGEMPRGSFLQPYLCMKWDDARWQQEFASMREAGMDFVILMSTVTTDTAGVSRAIYPSAIEGVQPADEDVVEACLRNASRCGMKVMTGLNFDDRWWQLASGGMPLWLEPQLELGNKVAAEIVHRYGASYGDVMMGWYWVWEVEPSCCTNPVVLEVLTQALNVNLDCLHALTPGKPVMLSPFMNQATGTASECAAVWKHLLGEAHFADGDIFAPQDCIGSGYLTMDSVGEWFARLREVIPTKPAVRFWANLELFDQRTWASADMGRVKRQHDLVAESVDGYITFAYSHYISPWHKAEALHRAYCHYVTTGTLLDSPAPKAVTRAKYANGFVSWEHTSDNEWLLGYRVRRDGELVADMQLTRQGGCKCVLKAEQAGSYAITACDVWGRESSAVEVTVP